MTVFIVFLVAPCQGVRPLVCLSVHPSIYYPDGCTSPCSFHVLHLPVDVFATRRKTTVAILVELLDLPFLCASWIRKVQIFVLCCLRRTNRKFPISIVVHNLCLSFLAFERDKASGDLGWVPFTPCCSPLFHHSVLRVPLLVLYFEQTSCVPWLRWEIFVGNKALCTPSPRGAPFGPDPPSTWAGPPPPPLGPDPPGQIPLVWLITTQSREGITWWTVGGARPLRWRSLLVSSFC